MESLQWPDSGLSGGQWGGEVPLREWTRSDRPLTPVSLPVCAHCYHIPLYFFLQIKLFSLFMQFRLLISLRGLEIEQGSRRKCIIIGG